MAFSTTTIQPVQEAVPATSKPSDGAAASVLGALLLAMYAGAKSRKQLRRLRRHATWLIVKQKARSFFKKPDLSERQTIIYILLGILVVAFVIIEPVAALVLAIIGLLLILTGII